MFDNKTDLKIKKKDFYLKKFKQMWSRCPPKWSCTRPNGCHNAFRSVWSSLLHASIIPKISFNKLFLNAKFRPIQMKLVEHFSSHGPSWFGASVGRLVQAWSSVDGHRYSERSSAEIGEQSGVYKQIKKTNQNFSWQATHIHPWCNCFHYLLCGSVM